MKYSKRYVKASAYALVAVLCGLGLGITIAFGADWPQWGHDQNHTGATGAVGQNLNTILADIVYDPFVAQEQADPNGDNDLLAHFQTPLVDGNDVFMEFKSGNFTTIKQWGTQTWNERRLNWQSGQLGTVWNFASDWKPEPFDPSGVGPQWEPVFHAALVGSFVYVPGAGGTVYKLNRATGSVAAQINPFGTPIKSNIYVSGPISSDSAGNVYYNALKLNAGNPWEKDVIDSWLVKVTASGTATKVSYSTLVPGAPAATDPCKLSFDPKKDPLPWPPSPTAQPATTPCGSQRPGINVAPAIAADGTIYSVTRAHLVTRYNYVVAINSNLTPKWNASMRGRLSDGCGVPVSAGGQLPPNGAPGGCRVGSTLGVDPGTNEAPPGRVLDDSSSSPVIAPDGSVIYGAYTRYNYAQGHIFHFAASGAFLNAFQFGWDDTPGIYSHDGTYSVVTKDNHYGEVGSYCNDPNFCPEDRTIANTDGYPEAYYVTQLSPAMTIEWSFQNTNTFACTRNPNNSVTCDDGSAHPNGFEWCVNAPAIDGNGVVYANSEDGNLFAINQGGTLKQKIFQQLAIGAAYTPASIGNDGKIYSQNDGHLYVVGN